MLSVVSRARSELMDLLILYIFLQSFFNINARHQPDGSRDDAIVVYFWPAELAGDFVASAALMIFRGLSNCAIHGL